MIHKDVPFVPSTWERINSIINLAGDVKDKKIVDLGCGDGRVIIALAKLGAQAFGYEIDPELCEATSKNIEEANLLGKAFVVNTNYWEESLETYDLVIIYGITGIMGRLEEKLRKELKPGAKVISNYFTFPTWQPFAQKGDVYLYLQK